MTGVSYGVQRSDSPEFQFLRGEEKGRGVGVVLGKIWGDSFSIVLFETWLCVFQVYLEVDK